MIQPFGTLLDKTQMETFQQIIETVRRHNPLQPLWEASCCNNAYVGILRIVDCPTCGRTVTGRPYKSPDGPITKSPDGATQ